MVLFSANHEYKLYDRYYEDDGSSKFNIKVDLEGSRGTNIDVCEGENNPNSFIDKAITYENMEIISFCNSVVGLTGNEGQYMCGSGYDTTTSTSSTLTTGVVVEQIIMEGKMFLINLFQKHLDPLIVLLINI